jgi:serine protease Do
MQSIYNSIIRILANNQDYDYLNPPNIKIESQSIGTGFFISPTLIITCCHVVENGNTLFFTMPLLSNKKYKLEIIALAPDLDLALVNSIEYTSEDYLQLVNSDLVQLQDSIIVVGYPLGQDKIKATRGIISGIQFGNIQTDSAINSGNSGGPLLDSKNNVIGIVSSKVSNAAGVGYAIPTKLLNIFDTVDKSKKIYYSCDFLANFSNTSEHRINMINKNLKDKTIISGYTISFISKYSPLNTIKVEPGDLIIEFNDILLNNFGELNLKLAAKYELTDYIERLNTDKNYNIKFYSFSQNKIIDTQLKFKNENLMGIKKLIPILDKLDYININGLILSQLTINLIRKYTKIKKNLNYVDYFTPKLIVANILPDSDFILNENIKQGDIITKINNINVFTINDVKELLKQNNDYLTFETKKYKLDTIKMI